MKNLKSNIVKKCRAAEKVALVTHKNPDGDGLAACLGLKRISKKIFEINCSIVLEEKPSDKFDFLDVTNETVVFNDNLQYDLLILIDCHEQNRIGRCSPLVDKAKDIFTIDHHHQRELIDGAFNYINTEYVSAGVIIFDMFENEIEALTGKDRDYVVDSIYTTILNDTDNFVNANVDEKVFTTCTKLSKLGLFPGYVYEKFFMGKTPSEMKFVGEVLSSISTHKNDEILFIESTLEQLERLKLDSEATSKMTRWLKGTKNVAVIVYYREIDKNKYRLSLRSNIIDVNKMAQLFGGGGHTKAAGCEISGTLLEIQNKILKLINIALDETN